MTNYTVKNSVKLLSLIKNSSKLKINISLDTLRVKKNLMKTKQNKKHCTDT